MIDEPAKYPGSSGCRNLRDVESDLKAVRVFPARLRLGRILTDICSKSRPITRVFSLSRLVSTTFRTSAPGQSLFGTTVVADYSLKTVQEYMYHIRNNAEFSVRNLLKDVAKRAGTNVLEAIDYLDDGSPVSHVHHP